MRSFWHSKTYMKNSASPLNQIFAHSHEEYQTGKTNFGAFWQIYHELFEVQKDKVAHLKDLKSGN